MANPIKRTNRTQTPAEVILVGASDQALAAGALVNSTSALAIASNQLGVLSWDFEGTVALGTFITAGVTAAQVNAIKILQGTAASNAIHTADPFEINDSAYVASGIIHRDMIRSISSMTYKTPVYSAHAVTSIPTVTVSTEYGAYVSVNSVRNDRVFSDNDEVAEAVVTTPASVSGIDGKGYVLNNLIYNLNSQSRVVTFSNSAQVRRGNKDYVVLGINTAGTAQGQALGTITCAGTPTSFRIQADYDAQGNATYTTLTANAQLVAALAKVIKAQADVVAAGTSITDQITTSSTVEVVDIKNASKGVQARGTVTITNYANLATDTITVNGTALVEGTDWAAGASNAAAATSLASAINALTGFSATASGAVVTIISDAYGTAGNAYTLTYTAGTGNGATVSGATFTGGSATNINAFIVIGLDQVKGAYSDNIEQVMTDVTVNPSKGFLTTGTITTTKTAPSEGTGQGFKWVISSDDRYQLTVHTAQNHPHGEFFSSGKTYINPNLNYTSYIIEYYDTEETMTVKQVYPQKVKILLAATSTCTTVSQAVTNLATTTAITTATTDTTTVTSLNAILGAWLISAKTYSGHEVKGEATSGTYFV